jgi:hypothetical protein
VIAVGVVLGAWHQGEQWRVLELVRRALTEALLVDLEQPRKQRQLPNALSGVGAALHDGVDLTDQFGWQVEAAGDLLEGRNGRLHGLHQLMPRGVRQVREPEVERGL